MSFNLSDSSDLSQSRRSKTKNSSYDGNELLAESKCIQLTEENELLSKQNTVLKAQFEQAIQIEPKLSNLHNRNRQLASELRSTNTEIDDLQKRLQISQKRNDELSQKLQQEKQIQTVTRAQSLQSAEKQMKRAKAQAKAQIDDLCGQLEELQAENDQQKTELKMMNTKVNRILENAQRYFNTEFKDVDAFINYLTNAPLSTSQNQSRLTASAINPNRSLSMTPTAQRQQMNSAIVSNDNSNIAQLEKKLKRERSKNNKLATTNDELENQINNLKRELNELNIQHKSEVDQLNQKAKQTEERQALADAETRHTISNLQNKVETLKSRVTELKQKAEAAEAKLQQQRALSFEEVPQESYIPPYFYGSPQIQGHRMPQQYNNYSNQIQSPQFGQQQQSATQLQTPLSRSSRSAINPPGASPRRSHFEEDVLNSCAASDHLVNQNIDLNQQLKNAKQRCKELEDKLRKSENDKANLEIELDKKSNDLNSIAIVHENTVKELDMMRSALHEKETSKERSDRKLMKREFNEQKAQLETMKTQLQCSKQQLSEISLQHQEDLSKIDALNDQIKELKEEMKRMDEAGEEVKEELSTTQAQLESHKRNEVTIDSILPNSAYYSHEFFPELNSAIAKIGDNQSLQPASKIQQIYKVVAKKYGMIITARDAALDEAFTENQTIRNEVHKFLGDLSISLDLEPISFDDFFRNSADEKIFDVISELRNARDDLNRKNEHLTDTINRVNQTFQAAQMGTTADGASGIGGSLEDLTYNMEAQVNAVRNDLSETKQQLSKKTKKCRELSSSLKSMKKKAETAAEDNRVEIERLKEQTTILQHQNEDLLNENKKLKWDIQQITTEFGDYKEMHEETAEELKEKMEVQNKQAVAEKERVETDLKEQLRSISEQFNSTNDYLAEHQEEIIRLKKVVESQKAIIREKESEIDRLIQEHEDALQETDSKYNEEKKGIITSYEKTLADLKQQCENHRLDVEKLTKQLTTLEKKNKQAKETILQLKKDKIASDAESRNQIDQLERQNKLIETSSKVELLNSQTEFNNKLEEERKKNDEEKKRIYSTVADTFRNYLSVSCSLNEKSFKNVIFAARDELSRLSNLDNSVRRLVNAANSQRTDDAVAQALMNHK